MGHPTNTQIKKAIDEGVAKILRELEVIKQQGRPAGLHIESGWKDKEKEGSWYEGGNPHKDDSQETYDPEVDDWDKEKLGYVGSRQGGVMAISDEMREQLEMVVQYGDQIKAMFKEQDSVDYEIGDYDEPITQLLGHMNEIMETIDGGW